MTASRLAKSYLEKATKRLKILRVLLEEGSYSDVVGEAQEIVELAQKAMLRHRGIEPPKHHDLGPFLLENTNRFSNDVQERLQRLAEISAWLRKEREFFFTVTLISFPLSAIQWKMPKRLSMMHNSS